MDRGEKFAMLLQHLEKCSESIVYYDEIASIVQQIRQMESIMAPIHFHPNQVFDETKHVIDVIAKKYLEKATDNVHHLVPIKVAADGNCLYNSILLVMNNLMATADELRVRTIIELMINEAYYENIFSQFIGSVTFVIKAICKNNTFSELYEISALCNVLRCNIRSIYPKIDFREDMAILNNVFTPRPSIIANCDITILWSHVWNELDARATNNNVWSPNHFVPLMQSFVYDESDHSNMSTSIAVTPEKKTFKNNTSTRIRSPEFELSPSRRLRTENNMGTNFAQSIISNALQQHKSGIENQRQVRLDILKERALTSRMNETTEHRQIRLEKQKERDDLKQMTETEEERQIRLEKKKENARSHRRNETEEQHQIRLEKQKIRDQSSRSNNIDEQRQIRLEKQRKRSQANRAKKKLEKLASGNIDVQQQDIEMQFTKTEEYASCDGKSISGFTQNSNVKKKNSSCSPWPEPIPRDLKETCLQQFLQQMSMSALAEVTCAVCNVRSLVQTSKKVPVSKIPNIHLLKVSDELKDLILSTQSSVLRHSIDDTTQMTGHVQSSTSFNSASFYYENGIILYTNGLHQENKTHMSTLCQKYHVALTKGIIPKFSAANNMWLGDVPAELQDLTIPEEKL
ncbi:unnamed protein product, partial [Rotaria sp. Silwood1]